MTRSRSAPMGLLACVALVCMTLLNQPFVYAEPASSMENIEPGVPMKSTPVNLMPRSDAFNVRQAKDTLSKFRPTNVIQLRFVDASDDNYAHYGACHHVDMDVELKSDDLKPEKQYTIQSINPFAFQHAVRNFSCTGTGKNLKLNLELDPRFADQVRSWNVGSSKVFGVVIPHDFVDLKKNKACFAELSEEAKKWAKTRPMETVVKMVKNPRFLNAKKNNVVSFSVVKTNIWSRMSRKQSVHIAHRDMDMHEIVPLYFHKRSTAYEKGPMWNFERDLSPATKTIANQISANNVKANMDRSNVKGYAQADMAWSQTCIWNIFVSRYSCITWGLSAAKVSGMTEINHSTSVDIKKKDVGRSNGPSNPLLTLTRVNVTTPTFTVVAPIPMLGFSVPGVFDLGANVAVAGSVSLNILVQATEDLLLNTGSATSCPWTIDWNGGLTSLPQIQFGTCTLPGTPKLLTDPTRAFNIKSHDNSIYMGPHPRNGRRVNSRDAILGAVPSAPARGRGRKDSRQTAAVRLGLNVIPSLNLGLKVFGFSAVNAGVVAPLNLGINTNWDTQKTEQCPANNVALFADGQASVMIEGTFFGFTRSTPPLVSPRLDSPAICIKV
ncbi:hypothetical protein BGZ97_002655 [Linnemannia gamsii]|uniref:Uncharacterized protein n=1 Tax=Linnemannia gamsii TaxID=64522 RepID=A0A9P6QWU4_9FUNG|nr:hypothetical protein BGZ97_002655 [Linnemannia gamsii]